MLKALEPFFLKIPKLTEQAELEDYMMKYPNVCSWKTVAEVLYRCTVEKCLDTLSAYMKSSEGMFNSAHFLVPQLLL